MSIFSKFLCCCGRMENPIEECSDSSLLWKTDASKKYEGKSSAFSNSEIRLFGLFDSSIKNKPFNLESIVKTKSLIQSMSFGKNHTVIKFADFSTKFGIWGSNQFGQLGVDINEGIVSEVRLLELNDLSMEIKDLKGWEISDIACSAFNTYLLLNNPKISTSRIIKLGMDDVSGNHIIKDNSLKSIKEEVFAPLKVKGIITNINQDRILLLSENGDLYLKGNDFELNSYKDFTLFLKDYNISSVSLGINHLCFLTRINELYALGTNSNGELGIGEEQPFNENDSKLSFTSNKGNAPILIPFFKNTKITKVSTGDRHTLVLTNKGDVYAFGDNSFNQCSGLEEVIYLPKKLTLDFKVIDIFSGSFHNCLLSDKGDLYSFGDNTYEKLGYYFGNTQEQNPHKIPLLNGYSIGFVSLSENQTIVVTNKEKDSLITNWYKKN